jgi:hypothetical protein
MAGASRFCVIGSENRRNVARTVENTDNRRFVLRGGKEDDVVAMRTGSDVIPKFRALAVTVWVSSNAPALFS